MEGEGEKSGPEAQQPGRGPAPTLALYSPRPGSSSGGAFPSGKPWPSLHPGSGEADGHRPLSRRRLPDRQQPHTRAAPARADGGIRASLPFTCSHKALPRAQPPPLAASSAAATGGASFVFRTANRRLRHFRSRGWPRPMGARRRVGRLILTGATGGRRVLGVREADGGGG